MDGTGCGLGRLSEIRLDGGTERALAPFCLCLDTGGLFYFLFLVLDVRFCYEINADLLGGAVFRSVVAGHLAVVSAFITTGPSAGTHFPVASKFSAHTSVVPFLISLAAAVIVPRVVHSGLGDGASVFCGGCLFAGCSSKALPLFCVLKKIASRLLFRARLCTYMRASAVAR